MMIHLLTLNPLHTFWNIFFLSLNEISTPQGESRAQSLLSRDCCGHCWILGALDSAWHNVAVCGMNKEELLKYLQSEEEKTTKTQ